MTEDEVRARAHAMPLTNPAFPPGPYRFVDREFFIITYRTDPHGAYLRTGPLLLRGHHRKGRVGRAGRARTVPARAGPVASLPVREVLSGVHIQTDLTLGLGTVVHDYLANHPAK
jgi:acetoacetate decarboxylase